MPARILVACSPGEWRIAALDGATLVAYAIWRPGRPDGLGDIFAGRITARVPAMAGAFVDLGGQTGFLPDSEGTAPEGALVRVRVTRTAQGGKGPRLVADGGPAPDAPGLVQSGPTALDRLAAQFPTSDIEVDDASVFAALRAPFRDRLRLVAHAFDPATEDQVAALASPWIALPGGLRASIFPTPALTAIDIDGGSSTAARGQKSGVQMRANREAIAPLLRQAVLRNLSGAILIDFAGIPAKRRASLAPDLQAALASDPARPRLLGFSQLGFAEILRPRGGAPLHEMLAGPHAAGLAALRYIAANPAGRPVLRAHPSVVAAIQSDPAALPDLARGLVHPLILRTDAALPETGWILDQT